MECREAGGLIQLPRLPFLSGVPTTVGEEGRPLGGGVLLSGILSNGAEASISPTSPFSAIVAEGNAGLKGTNRGGGVVTARDGEGEVGGECGERVDEGLLGAEDEIEPSRLVLDE